MANYDNTRNTVINEVGDGYYANSFYGTYDHFQRIGWFFDKVVSEIADLDECLDVLTGRFVLVEDKDAIFMRDYAYDEEGNYFNYYDGGYIYQNGQFIPNPNGETYNIKGFKFIGFATRRSKLLLSENGEYYGIDVNDDTPYKIAKTKNVQQLSAYYFPSLKNRNVFHDINTDSKFSFIIDLELDKDKDNYDEGYQIQEDQ